MQSPGTGPTIIVADDEAPIRLVVSEKLRSVGFTAHEARDGEEALDLALKHRPAAIITDLQMPYMNGLELATRLRVEPATSSIPVLLLTARGHIISDDQVSRTNIKKVMSKPFSVRDLLAFVQTQLLPSTLTPSHPAAAGTVGPSPFIARNEAA